MFDGGPGDEGGGGGGGGDAGTVAGGTGGGGGVGGAGTGGDPAGGSGGEGGTSGGPAKSMGYVGCSMSENVARGYEAIGGERLWPPLSPYMGMVVQNWANTNDPVWSTFEQQVSTYGTPSAVWVMICIFSNMVTYDETKQIIANVRQRIPDATIYITGQPLYEAGLTCTLAGVGGPELTDEMAQQAANDPTQNVIYGGIFGPLSAAHTAGDFTGCHANTEGQRFLGQQAIDKWGE